MNLQQDVNIVIDDKILKAIPSGFKISMIDSSDGLFTLYRNGSPPIVLNETAYDILQLCNGINTINEIIINIATCYAQKFNYIQDDIVKMIFQLWNNDLIRWVDINPFSKYLTKAFGAYTYYVTETNQIDYFIEATKKNSLISKRINEEMIFSNYTKKMRDRLLSETFFEFYYENELQCYICLRPTILLNITVFDIQYLYTKNNIALSSFENFLSWCVNWFNANEDINILRLYTYSNILNQYNHIINKLDFKYNGKLRNERGNKDINVFSKTVTADQCDFP